MRKIPHILMYSDACFPAGGAWGGYRESSHARGKGLRAKSLAHFQFTLLHFGE